MLLLRATGVPSLGNREVRTVATDFGNPFSHYTHIFLYSPACVSAMSSAVVPAAPAFTEAYVEHTMNIVFANKDDAFSKNHPFVVVSPNITALRAWRANVRTAEGSGDCIEICVGTDTRADMSATVSLALYGGEAVNTSTCLHNYFVKRSTLEAHHEWRDSGTLVLTIGVKERELTAKPRVVYSK